LVFGVTPGIYFAFAFGVCLSSSQLLAESIFVDAWPVLLLKLTSDELAISICQKVSLSSIFYLPRPFFPTFYMDALFGFILLNLQLPLAFPARLGPLLLRLWHQRTLPSFRRLNKRTVFG
jgi:hypothetical protein